MKDNLTREEKRIIVREHNAKVMKTRIMLFIATLFPLAVLCSMGKIDDEYISYLFYGSWIIFLIPVIRLISLSACPFCGYVDPRRTSKLRHFHSDYCPNCKEKIK